MLHLHIIIVFLGRDGTKKGVFLLALVVCLTVMVLSAGSVILTSLPSTMR